MTQLKTQEKGKLSKAVVVDSTIKRIKELTNKGELSFPANYNVANAVQSAWLILSKTTDVNKKPALETCTQPSVLNSLFNMAVSGLNPAKNQCYFIPYNIKGTMEMTLSISYFGMMALAKRVNPNIKEITAEVVRQGQEFSYGRKNGRTMVFEHKMSFDTANNEIIGAYATTVYRDGTEDSTVLSMTDIRKAWSKSKTGQAVHKEWPEEMAKKTVIRRHCKPIINSSDDSYLIDAFNQQEASAEATIDHEIDEKANSKEMDIDTETGEIFDAQFEDMNEVISEEEATKLAEQANSGATF